MEGAKDDTGSPKAIDSPTMLSTKTVELGKASFSCKKKKRKRCSIYGESFSSITNLDIIASCT